MKIIFANNYFYLRGGSERVFFDELEILKANAHEVVPFSRHFQRNIPSEYSDFFAPPIEYRNVSISEKITSSANLIYSFECKKRFSKLLDFFTPDIIHAHNIYGRLSTSIIDAAKERKVPVVMTLHDYKMICPSYLLLVDGAVCDRCQGKRFFYCVLKRCHKRSFVASLIYTLESYHNMLLGKYDWVRYFICPSKFLMQKHVEAGISDERLVHIPHFVDIRNFVPTWDPGEYIVFLGRLSKEKGVLTLLRAVKGVGVAVRIVGDGPLRAKYEAYARDNDVSNVTFEGYKTGDELKDIVRNAAFAVVPSEWYENLPMSIIESFAFGKPVIGSNLGGIPEMVIENETGLIFEQGNYQELRQEIEFLISSPSAVIEMGKKARKKVEKEYNSEIVYQRLVEVYERACS